MMECILFFKATQIGQLPELRQVQQDTIVIHKIILFEVPSKGYIIRI
uniref:Uncharacterized protein n=1 Tax=Tetranychus urticae TaxID=32264 RepID=T1K5E1_TETUR